MLYFIICYLLHYGLNAVILINISNKIYILFVKKCKILLNRVIYLIAYILNIYGV